MNDQAYNNYMSTIDQVIFMEKKIKLILCFTNLHSQLLRRIDQHLSLHGISFSEFLGMYNLNDAPKMTMRRIDLAESIGLSASGVTRLVNPMKKNRLV